MRLLSLLGIAAGLLIVTPRAEAEAEAETGHDFIADAKALLVVGACADGAAPSNIRAALIKTHCKAVRAAQDQYRTSWLAIAREFFAAQVPTRIPKAVVYPFAGGDLSTALAVYPDADEITTLSLEPAGDPRALGRLTSKQLATALTTVSSELRSLYRSSYSVTMNMISAMRGGKLPTQLIFTLSALSIHGYEPTSLRYFQVNADGSLEYLNEQELATAEAIKDVGKRNRAFANIELRFRKQGSSREQIYRHIMANLDDAHLATTPGALRYLESKGKVAGMTKAASYLLSFNTFSTMRKYIAEHVVWMVSDSTGLPPKYGKPAGFEYETHGEFAASNMRAGGEVAPAWRAMYAEQPKRPLKFRFGYPDKKHRGHLIVMRRAAST